MAVAAFLLTKIVKKVTCSRFDDCFSARPFLPERHIEPVVDDAIPE